jgi:hypothetical protein
MICPFCQSIRVENHCESPNTSILYCHTCTRTFAWEPAVNERRPTPRWQVIEVCEADSMFRDELLLGNYRWYFAAWLRLQFVKFWLDPAAGLTTRYELRRVTLKTLRLQAQMGLRCFAQHIGMLPSAYCDVELGKRPPDAGERAVICRGLHVTELPHIPPYVPDKGPLIPLYIRRADGKPATEQDYDDMYKYLNDPDSPRGN